MGAELMPETRAAAVDEVAVVDMGVDASVAVETDAAAEVATGEFAASAVCAALARAQLL